MLSARAYSFRQKSRLAISLSWIGGYTNVVALLATGHMASHVTGTATLVGLDLIDHHWPLVWFFAYLLFTFLAGAASSGILIESSLRRGARSKYIIPMLLEAGLLIAFGYGLYLHPNIAIDDWFNQYWMSGAASFAMGLQNATITKISGAVVRTTHLTGVATDLGLESVQMFLWWRDRTRKRRWSRTGRLLRISQRHPTTLRVLLLASIIGSFIFGVAAGTWLFHAYPQWVMIPPVMFLMWIVVVDWWSPIADVREIDQLSDPELKAFGLIKALLPPEIGIYRLWFHRHNAEYDAPNFQHWADGVPRKRRVVILALSPLMKLDENAAMDLLATVESLRTRRQHLLISGMNQHQFRILDHLGFDRRMSPEDFCPDIEFAIARGIALIRSGRA